MSKRGQIPHIRRRTGEIRIFISGNSLVAAKSLARDPHARHAPGMAARVDGGAYRDRTDDLKLAKLALSQLS